MPRLRERLAVALGRKVVPDSADIDLDSSLPNVFRTAKKGQYAAGGFPTDSCAYCRRVCWSAFADPHLALENHPQHIYDDAIGEHIRSTSCSICQVLSDGKPQAYAGLVASRASQYLSEKRSLSGLPTSEKQNRNLRHGIVFMNGYKRDSVLVGIHDLNSHLSDFSPRLISPTSIDFTVLRGWLSHCEKEHMEACYGERDEKLPGFRVIDCRSRCVVEAPDRCEYAALSYVWGLASARHSSVLDTSAPATIQDSITVVLALGIDYLWIDRYCIDQSNYFEKHTQIRNMHRIYSEAFVTIIVAAGDDPTYGLPGVSIRSRKPQRCVQVGGISLVQMFSKTSDSVACSTWNKRAWTFQEAVLAKRKLIFTDRQVSFLCESTYCAESIATLQPSGLRDEYINELLPRGPRKAPSALLHQYMMRSLSYDSDALNAFLGILNSLEGWNHIWGVAFAMYKNKILLDWYHLKPGRRRKDFPSWSWAGWEGALGLKPKLWSINQGCMFEIMGIDHRIIAMNNGIKTGIPTSHISDTTLEATKILEATSYAFPIEEFREDTLYGQPVTLASVPVSSHVNNVFRVYMDEICAVQDAYALAMDWVEEPSWRVLVALVVTPIGEGLYSRIGYMAYEAFEERLQDYFGIPSYDTGDGEGPFGSLWPVQARWKTLRIR